MNAERCTAEQHDPEGVGSSIRCVLDAGHDGLHEAVLNAPRPGGACDVCGETVPSLQSWQHVQGRRVVTGHRDCVVPDYRLDKNYWDFCSVMEPDWERR